MDDRTEPRTDFLTALAQRALGVAPRVRPRLRPRFATTRPTGGPIAEAFREESTETLDDAGPDPDSRTGDAE